MELGLGDEEDGVEEEEEEEVVEAGVELGVEDGFGEEDVVEKVVGVELEDLGLLLDGDELA